MSLCRVAALKVLPLHRYSVIIITFSGPLGGQGSTLLFGNRDSLYTGLGGIRDISHEKARSIQ